MELSSISTIEPEIDVQHQAQNPMFNLSPPEIQHGGPHILAQPPEAPHHVPYLMNQAQQQFALMEQQYEQQVQQEEHQKYLSNQSTTGNHFAMDMCDSDSSSMQLQPEDPPTEESNPSAEELLPHNELIDFSSDNPADIANSPAIPISHILAGNAYPSLTKSVPVGIAQSFAPMYVQPQLADQQGGDIYNDYVQNPYNLVLHSIDPQHQSIAEASNHPVMTTLSELAVPTTTTTLTTAPIANVFQSANYFGNDQSTRIPPGSEMLFSSP